MTALATRASLVLLLLIPSWAPGQPLAPPPDEQRVDEILSRMTLREKIGQLFMVGFRSDAVACDGGRCDETIATLLEEFRIGGVVLFERNIRGMRPNSTRLSDPEDVARSVARLTNALQNGVRPLDGADGARIPLLIAADQENGSNIRIEVALTELPGALGIGQTRDADLAHEAGWITGSELRALGINMNLAPVLDVNTNAHEQDIISDRAFGGHRDIVEPLGTAFIRGLQDGSAVAVAKHFPGHGDSRVNPHDDLPEVESPLPTIEDIDLPPFEAAIDAGVGAIMTAHMHYRALSSAPGLPFSMDPRLRELLRDRMGFTGVVVSDDLVGMRAATPDGGRSLGDAVRLSFAAGSDLITLAHFCRLVDERTHCIGDELKLEDFRTVFGALEERFRDDRTRVDESVRRILRLKSKIFPDFEATTVDENEVADRVRTPVHLAAAADIARSAIVLLREKGLAVPNLDDTQYFSGDNTPLANVDNASRILVVSPVFRRPERLGQAIAAGHHTNVETIPLVYGWGAARGAMRRVWPGALVGNALEDRIRERARGAAVIVFGVMEREHGVLLRSILESTGDTPVFAVLGRQPNILPYEVLYNENVTTLSAGSNNGPSMEAIADVLYGELDPKSYRYVSVSVDPDNWIDIGRHPLEDVRNADERVPAPVPDPPPGPDDDPIRTDTGVSYAFCFLAGLVGALAAVSGAGRFPHGWWVDSKEGDRRPGWVPLLGTRAVCGLVLYALVEAGAGWPALDAVAPDGYVGAMLFGFLGGAAGHPLLSSLPMGMPLGGRRETG